jgi:Na+/pantothenate symporter
MNIKSLLGKIQWRRDLIRLWVAGTVTWAVLWLLVAGLYPQSLTNAQLGNFASIFVGVPALLWALLFAGFRIASGFTREQSK